MTNQKLPSKSILKSSIEFGNVFSQGEHIHFEYFSSYFVLEDELRVGFTTRKDYKNKPMRNRMKRILRELWRRNFKNYILPAHIVLVAKTNILLGNHNRLEVMMKTALSQIEKKLSEMRLEQGT